MTKDQPAESSLNPRRRIRRGNVEEKARWRDPGRDNLRLFRSEASYYVLEVTWGFDYFSGHVGSGRMVSTKIMFPFILPSTSAHLGRRSARCPIYNRKCPNITSAISLFFSAAFHSSSYTGVQNIDQNGFPPKGATLSYSCRHDASLAVDAESTRRERMK